jgi:hypothetical protein
LRAISITHPGTREIVEMVTAQTGEHTRIAPPPKKRAALPWVAAGAAITLAVAVLLSRVVELRGTQAAAAGVQGGAALVTNEQIKPPPVPTAQLAPVAEAKPAAETKPAAPDAASAPSQPAAQSAVAAPAKSAIAARPASPRASNKPADKAHSSKAAAKPQTDLLAPDYAR